MEDIQRGPRHGQKPAAAEARKRSTKMFEAVPQPEAEDSRLPKMLSAQVLDGATKEPESWALANEFGNAQLQALVKEFLKQVKNMLFLDVVENVLTYYLRFEALLADRPGPSSGFPQQLHQKAADQDAPGAGLEADRTTTRPSWACWTSC